MKPDKEMIEENVSAQEDILHLRNYFAPDLTDSLDALNSLNSLLKALEMTVEEMAEMCGEDEDDPADEEDGLA